MFTRPWCIGEMCVASAKGVSVILIKMPDYVLPDEKFIAELRERLSDLEVLTESGISEEILFCASIPHPTRLLLLLLYLSVRLQVPIAGRKMLRCPAHS